MSPTGDSVAAISQAALNLLEALPDDQRSAISFPFDDPSRRQWHYTPGVRRGVSLAEMGRAAAKAVHLLLGSVISAPTHAQVAAIAGLEDVLDEAEGGRRGRHAGDYWTALFGGPGSDVWGWRFEGHHVSINLTLSGGEVSATPCFLGANPAAITTGSGSTVSRPLAPEEDVALALVASLDGPQRARAVTSDEAPPDILTSEAPDLGGEGAAVPGEGLPAAALRPDQMSLLRTLAAVYVTRLGNDLAAPFLARLDQDLPSFCFAWAGPAPPASGQPHYYRLAGPRFLVEFDNRQNGANHVHSVWRDPGGDFGARLLAKDHPGLS